jgi:hypothetical protein
MSAQHLTVRHNTRCPVCDAGIDWRRDKLLAVVLAALFGNRLVLPFHAVYL